MSAVKRCYVVISDKDFKNMIGEQDIMAPPLQCFFLLCLCELAECVMLSAQRHYERGGNASVRALLFWMLCHARATKFHYWENLTQFISLLDSPLQCIDFTSWKKHATFFRLTHQMLTDDALIKQILRFCEIFLPSLCLPNRTHQLLIGSHQLSDLMKDYSFVRMQIISQCGCTHWMSDLGDRYARSRTMLYNDVEPAIDDRYIRAPCPQMAHDRIPELALITKVEASTSLKRAHVE